MSNYHRPQRNAGAFLSKRASARVARELVRIVGDISSRKKSGSQIGSVVTWSPLVSFLLHAYYLLVDLILTPKMRCNYLQKQHLCSDNRIPKPGVAGSNPAGRSEKCGF